MPACSAATFSFCAARMSVMSASSAVTREVIWTHPATMALNVITTVATLPREIVGSKRGRMVSLMPGTPAERRRGSLLP